MQHRLKRAAVMHALLLQLLGVLALHCSDKSRELIVLLLQLGVSLLLGIHLDFTELLLVPNGCDLLLHAVPFCHVLHCSRHLLRLLLDGLDVLRLVLVGFLLQRLQLLLPRVIARLLLCLHTLHHVLHFFVVFGTQLPNRGDVLLLHLLLLLLQLLLSLFIVLKPRGLVLLRQLLLLPLMGIMRLPESPQMSLLRTRQRSGALLRLQPQLLLLLILQLRHHTLVGRSTLGQLRLKLGLMLLCVPLLLLLELGNHRLQSLCVLPGSRRQLVLLPGLQRTDPIPVLRPQFLLQGIQGLLVLLTHGPAVLRMRPTQRLHLGLMLRRALAQHRGVLLRHAP
mmetsp:Transcript_46581/g.78186  ORF Transcript_46581/g.78186 Transcript_46581/m.78186 type:complete len:337 (+) Transcript_46581:812-1822(+)